MTTPLESLIADVDNLIASARANEETHRAQINKVAPEHRQGAINLLHYAALRNHDVRPLQAQLANLGATRLTTAEPAVLARLQAARNVLSAYAGEALPFASNHLTDAFAQADNLLDQRADRLLGLPKEGAHSRIMVTIPAEAADNPAIIADFIDAGMDIARINCAHDDAQTWLRMINTIRACAQQAGRNIIITMDLAGPKVRTGEIKYGPEVVKARVRRNIAGATIHPSRIWITAHHEPPAEAEANTKAASEKEQVPADSVDNEDTTAPAGMDIPADIASLPGRDIIPIQVEQRFLNALREGMQISCYDNRNRSRTFTVERLYTESDHTGSTSAVAALLEGQQNAYISNHTILRADYLRTRVFGIPAAEQKLNLHIGDRLILTDATVVCDPDLDTIPRISCTLPEAVAAVQVGEPVLFDDGALASRCVEKTKNEDGTWDVTVEVTRAKPQGTNLAAHKGINMPDTDLPLASLTDDDVEALRFVTQHADVANVSFIRNAGDVAYLLEKVEEIAASSEDPQKARQVGLVLKVETIPAYQGLADVLIEGMRHPNLGVMIARGDLAVELGFDRMAEVPRLIAQMCEAAHIPVILATQVLEDLAKTGLPTRAEITDAAYALRNEAVMLNKGPHVTDAIRVLDQLSRKLGASQRKNRQMLRKIASWSTQD